MHERVLIVDYWKVGVSLYVLALAVTLLPVLRAILKKVELAPGGAGFNESPHFDEQYKELLEQHYSRIRGTLGYWKNQAELYKSLHYYSLIWTIPSAVIIPVLTPFISDGNFSKIAVTLLSAITAVLFAFHRGLKVEDNLRAYRHGESEFYDLVRRLLDRPDSFGESTQKQIETYFEEVARIRRFVRNAETDNLGTLDDARAELEKRRSSSEST